MRHWKKKPWVDSEVRNWDYIADHLAPDATSADAGKVLTVGETGKPEWGEGGGSGGGGTTLYGPYYLITRESVTINGGMFSIGNIADKIVNEEFVEVGFPDVPGITLLQFVISPMGVGIVTSYGAPDIYEGEWELIPIVVYNPYNEPLSIMEGMEIVSFYSTVEFPDLLGDS